MSCTLQGQLDAIAKPKRQSWKENKRCIFSLQKIITVKRSINNDCEDEYIINHYKRTMPCGYFYICLFHFGRMLVDSFIKLLVVTGRFTDFNTVSYFILLFTCLMSPKIYIF